MLDKQQMEICSLQMQLAAVQATVSDAHVRARQAEEIAAACMANVNLEGLGAIIGRHIEQKAAERAVQQQGLIQATLVSLNTALQSDDSKVLRDTVNNVVKGLTMANATMHEIQVKTNDLTRRSNGEASRN